MALNFNELPTEKPNSIIAAGRYVATIAAAEMKHAKDPSKPDYLNMRLDIFDNKNNKLGSVFDILTESAASLARYKLGRFLTALNLTLTNFELSDLVKLIVGKKLEVDLKIEETEGYAPRTVVDALSNEIYYNIGDDNLPFDAAASAEADASNISDNDDEY